MKPDFTTTPLDPTSQPLELQTRKLRFEIVDGPAKGQVAEVAGPEARIGSAKECDVVIADRSVSRIHLIVRIEGDAIRVLDTGSRNGTLVDGVRVRDAWARPDSSIVIGLTTLRLQMLDDVIRVPLSSREQVGGLLGRSVAMRRVFALLEHLATTDVTVLIEGETGTGKELAAEALHEGSARAAGPFVVFDCSAVSPTLIESELFGHTRGAFTGAGADRLGALEAADGGTLFLDEIGELPLDLQPRLLRALETREVKRVGSNLARKVDVRFIAATNRMLAREVDRGRFRRDLYYRLAVVVVSLPPLRERLEDIPLLVRHFESQFGGATARPPLPDHLLRAYGARAWPGNVRELRNAVARALSIGKPEAEPAHPGAVGADVEPAPNLEAPLLIERERVVDAFEKDYVERALAKSGGNVSRAAEFARVNRKFIQRVMKRCGLRGDVTGE